MKNYTKEACIGHRQNNQISDMKNIIAELYDTINRHLDKSTETCKILGDPEIALRTFITDVLMIRNKMLIHLAEDQRERTLTCRKCLHSYECMDRLEFDSTDQLG